MSTTKIKIGIICPLDDEYNACKEILELKSGSEVADELFQKEKKIM